MAETLETLEHLAIWTGKDPVIVAADPFAQMVLEKATELVVDKAEIPATWPDNLTLVPSRAKTICLLVASRTYTNRRSVISQSVGPISESILAAMAAAMQLTDAEAEELEAMANSNEDFGGLWVLSTTRGDDYPIVATVNLPDSSGSDWLIPYANEGETGAFDVMTAEGEFDPVAFAALQDEVTALSASLTSLGTNKADVSYVNAQLALKAAVTALNNGLALKANTTDMNTLLAAKADSDDVADALAAKANTADVDTALAGKASTASVAAKADLTYVNAQLALKAAQAALDALADLVDTKADADDLGVQIRLEQPESGSGELWADTEG